jgi:hypothetical protein
MNSGVCVRSFEIEREFAELEAEGIVGLEYDHKKAEYDIWGLFTRIKFGPGANDSAVRISAKIELEEKWKEYGTIVRDNHDRFKLDNAVARMYLLARDFKESDDSQVYRRAA